MHELVWLLLLFAQSVTTPAVRSQSEITSVQCATCHPKIAQTYARTGMGRSFYRPGEIGSTRYHHERSDTWFSVEQRAGAWYQRRWRIGFDGRETEVLESRIDYVMGSGNHVRTFLTKTSRGTLIELPLAWYSEEGGKWAMNPGHDVDHALAPRTVAYECMFCHNAYPRIPAGHSEPGSEALYANLPEGIDCQRCHGPGTAHVRAAQTPGATATAIRAAIVNPGRLNRDRQLEICYQCHLETTSLELPHSLLRYGREPFSYKPGEPLGNFQAFFDYTPGSKHSDDFEIAHSAYRLRRSKCFAESQMTCTTCHNPHDVRHGAEAIVEYNNVCKQCHTSLPANHTSAQTCTECHMPKRRAFDVPHAVMTDHHIQRRIPPGDLLASREERSGETPYKGEVVPYYPLSVDALHKAAAQVAHNANLARGVPALAAELARRKDGPAGAYVTLGEALIASGKPREGILALEQALSRQPNSVVAMLDLADALTQTKQNARAVALLDRALKLRPNEPLLWYQLGIAQSSASALQKAVDLDPALSDGWNLLGELRAESGDLAAAETAFRNALRYQPDLPDAQSNLGHLLTSLKRYREAEYYFTRTIRLKPNDADSRINYAVTLAGLGKTLEAIEQARVSIKANPALPESHNFLGSLLLRTNQPDAALGEFLEAIRLRPDFGLAHLYAADILRQRGDVAAARGHLQQAAKDPDPSIRQRATERLR